MQRSQGLKHKGFQISSPSQLLASSPKDNYAHASTKAALLQDLNEDEIQAHNLEDLPCTFPVGMFMLPSTALYTAPAKALNNLALVYWSALCFPQTN